MKKLPKNKTPWPTIDMPEFIIVLQQFSIQLFRVRSSAQEFPRSHRSYPLVKLPLLSGYEMNTSSKYCSHVPRGLEG